MWFSLHGLGLKSETCIEGAEVLEEAAVDLLVLAVEGPSVDESTSEGMEE